ncbi:MAG: Bax inhibitor-1 family protein [Bacteroidia bacterium]|nr:Bax inhibitor-1 family protein [Bacteroidia bacterium]
MREATLSAEETVKRSFLQRTYALAGISIAVSGLIAAAVYKLLETFGPPILLEQFKYLPRDLQGIALIVVGIMLLLAMLSLGLLLIKWVSQLYTPLFLIVVAWVAFAVLGGLLLSPVFYLAGYELTLKVFLATGAVFTATGLLAYTLRINLTRWGGQILSMLVGLTIMGAINLVLRSEWIEIAWMYGGLVLWIIIAAYAHQLLKYLPMPTEEERERGALTRLAIGSALLLYIIFYGLFIRLLVIALSQKGKSRR